MRNVHEPTGTSATQAISTAAAAPRTSTSGNERAFNSSPRKERELLRLQDHNGGLTEREQSRIESRREAEEALKVQHERVSKYKM